MPWRGKKDVERHNKKCSQHPECVKLWLDVANKHYANTGDDGQAVIRANVAAKKWLQKRGKYRRNMADAGVRDLERRFNEEPNMATAEALIRAMQRSNTQPSSKELADDLLYQFLLKYDVPYVYNRRQDGRVIHKIPVYSHDVTLAPHRGTLWLEFTDDAMLVLRFIRRFRGYGNEGELQFTNSGVPNHIITFLDLISWIPAVIVPDHQKMVDVISFELSTTPFQIYSDSRVDSHLSSTAANNLPHRHIFRLTTPGRYSDLDISLTVTRGVIDVMECRLETAINVPASDPWHYSGEVLGAALSGSGVEQFGLGADAPEGEELLEIDSFRSLHELRTLLRSYYQVLVDYNLVRRW